MNFKRQAEQLEKFLEEEFKSKSPLALLPNGDVAYEKFLIKQSKKKDWQLCRAKGYTLDTFNNRSSAIIAAKLYNSNNFSKYSELKVLDQYYHKNRVDADFFKERYNKTKDPDKRDLYLARFLNAEQHADYAKKQIAGRFKMLF